VWPFSPEWRDPLKAPGRIAISNAGLRVRLLGESGPTAVFIHGLGASLRYWGTAYDQLSHQSRLVFVDLLGFAGSEKPTGAQYDISTHAERIAATLEGFKLRMPLLVGHSTGVTIAMTLAAQRLPDSTVIGFGAPIFTSAAAARRHLRKLGPMERLMADRSPWARRLCAMLCDHREFARVLAPLLAPALPALVARDGVDHTWESYSGTFESMMRYADSTPLAGRLGGRLCLVYGRDDRTAPPIAARVRLGADAPISVIAGDHHLPLRRPQACQQIIADRLSMP
jgi:pimeloyl-ACP methyl ester carboxylesterase